MLAILAAVMLAAAPQFDTVFTSDGGRLLGTVVEESPQAVTVQLPDGTTRRFERKDVVRIEYKDGSVSTPNRPAPPPPAYAPPQHPQAPAAPPPPAYQPPPPPAYGPPPYRPPPPPPPMRQPTYYDAQGGMPPVLPLYLSFGIGGSVPTGNAEHGLAMSRIFDPQLDLQVEGGLRLTPRLALGMYLDAGLGEPASNVRAEPACMAQGTNCTASTGRFGLLLRHTFHPRAYTTPWISAGTGFEWGQVSLQDSYGGGRQEYFSYTGWEILRLQAGVDLRTSPVFGFGFYGGVGFGRYSRYKDAAGEVDLGGEPVHTTFTGGLRFTLFP